MFFAVILAVVRNALVVREVQLRFGFNVSIFYFCDMANKVKTKKSGRRGSKSKKHRFGLGWLIAGLSVLALAGVVAGFCIQSHRGDDAWVYVPKGSDADAIHDSLAVKLGDAEANRVMMLWRLQGGGQGARGLFCAPRRFVDFNCEKAQNGAAECGEGVVA